MLVETLRKWKPISNTPVYFKGFENKNDLKLEETQKPLASSKNLISIQEEATEDAIPEADFGLIAVDEMPPTSSAENQSDEEDNEDSDSTKSVLGSNQSLLLRPLR